MVVASVMLFGSFDEWLLRLLLLRGGLFVSAHDIRKRDFSQTTTTVSA